MSLIDVTAQIPAYSVKESRRARRVLLRITPVGALEITIPHGFDRRKIPQLIYQRMAWIHNAQKRLQRQQANMPPEMVGPMPGEIQLHALDEHWRVEYRQAESSRYRELDGVRLMIASPSVSPELSHQTLHRWLAQRARKMLLPWLRELSAELALPYGSVSVRGQKTRWGSCSSAGNISLNYKLLFLPSALVRYVLIHELCHTLELNHSPRFWAAVAAREPDYRQREEELRSSWRYVPLWVEMK